MDIAATTPARRSRWVVIALVPALLLMGLLTWATLAESSRPVPGDPAPAFAAPLLDGAGEVSLAELEGKPVVLNFWASWCAPCEDEAPMLKEAHERYGDSVHFVGIDIKDGRSDALAFVERYDLDFVQLRDEDLKIYNDYGLTGQPETFFIDASGTIVEHIPGTLNEPLLAGLIQEMVGAGG